jgi:hypothetical protein
MKKTALLLSLLISLFLPGLQAQENSAMPRFTEFRTPEEFDSGKTKLLMKHKSIPVYCNW